MIDSDSKDDFTLPIIFAGETRLVSDDLAARLESEGVLVRAEQWPPDLQDDQARDFFVACMGQIAREIATSAVLTDELRAAMRRSINDVGNALAEANSQLLRRHYLAGDKDRRDKLFREIDLNFYSGFCKGKITVRAGKIFHDLTFVTTPAARPDLDAAAQKEWKARLVALRLACGLKLPTSKAIQNILKGGRTPKKRPR